MDLAVIVNCAAIAALVSGALAFALRPILARYAMAEPNARSSHRVPTPQGGGIAVIAATILSCSAVALTAPGLISDPWRLATIFASVVGLSLVGATDDFHPLEAIPRLLFQAIAAIVVLSMLPPDFQIFHQLPIWIERPLLLVSIMWFVNLSNFMDGIDWMTVAEVTPITAALTLFGFLGAIPQDATVVAVALFGAMVGFAPFNKPVARLYLGDVGSLPIGLLLSWLLILLAGNGYFAAAILLPLYYISDSTITLLRRLINSEQITQAHRSHFYQRAFDGGRSVYQIVGRVVCVNLVLVALAASTIFYPGFMAQISALLAGAIVVGFFLFDLGSVRR